MKKPPVIIVQLVHIQGPLKGEIQEFAESTISIGRHASCLLKFPPDLTMISRKHAEIVREGNRFKLVDQSANGTFVNGKRIKETYLKNGDVLAFTEGGPKASFLTQIKEGQAETGKELPSVSQEKPIAPSPPPPQQQKPMHPPLQEKPRLSFDQGPPEVPELKKTPKIAAQKTKVPLIIQYGPTLRSFNEVPVTIGKGPGCGFKLDHPAIFDQHAQIFFNKDQYWVKDLTGKGLIMINNQPIDLQSPLNANDLLALTPKGPHFRFLGGGRLAEAQGPVNETPTDSGNKNEEAVQRGRFSKKDVKGYLSILKNFLKR